MDNKIILRIDTILIIFNYTRGNYSGTILKIKDNV